MKTRSDGCLRRWTGASVVFLRVSRARLMVAGVITGVNPAGLTKLMLAKLLGRAVAHESGTYCSTARATLIPG